MFRPIHAYKPVHPYPDLYDELILSESGLQAYLPLGDAIDTLWDLSGNEHHGTLGLVGAGSFKRNEPGIPAGGRSVRLTASASDVGAQIGLAGTFALGDGPFSYELWLKRAGSQAYWVGLINQEANGTPGFGFQADTDSCLEGFDRAGSDGVRSSVAISDFTEFHHAVWTKDTADTWLVYLDGPDVSTSQGARSTVTDSAQMFLGSWPNFNCFNGWLAKFAVYNVVLTPAQVLAHWEAGS